MELKEKKQNWGKDSKQDDDVARFFGYSVQVRRFLQSHATWNRVAFLQCIKRVSCLNTVCACPAKQRTALLGFFGCNGEKERERRTAAAVLLLLIWCAHYLLLRILMYPNPPQKSRPFCDFSTVLLLVDVDCSWACGVAFDIDDAILSGPSFSLVGKRETNRASGQQRCVNRTRVYSSGQASHAAHKERLLQLKARSLMKCHRSSHNRKESAPLLRSACILHHFTPLPQTPKKPTFRRERGGGERAPARPMREAQQVLVCTVQSDYYVYLSQSVRSIMCGSSLVSDLWSAWRET